MQEKRWITLKDGRRILINDYMNKKIREDNNKNKKVDYQKYLETRNQSVDRYIAIGGELKVLSEENANKLLELGVDEELLPYCYPLPDDYPFEQALANDENWLEVYINSALKTKERDAQYKIDMQEMALERQQREQVDVLLKDLNKSYDSKAPRQFKDYETDDVSYEIDDDTLDTITDDWGYKDSTTNHFYTLSEEQQTAVEDYTDENAKYNYRYFNNILNGHWKNEQIDEEGKKRMDLIDQAIDSSTIDENMYLYRTTNKAHITKDATLVNKGYSSTSLFKDVVDNFDNGDVLKIRVPKGTKGLYIGGNTMSLVAEYEVLLGRDLKLKVLGENDDGTIECIIIK